MPHAPAMDHGALRTYPLKPAFRIAMRVAGWLLSIAAIVFFCRLVMQNGLALRNHGAMQTIGIISAGALLYSMAVGVLALIWAGLANPGSSDKLTRRLLVVSYLKSQFAKYLPGNIFQYAARHALGRQLGLSHGSLAAAAILEALLLVSAASFLVAIFGRSLVQVLFPSSPSLPAISALLVLLVVPLIAYVPRMTRWQWLPRHSMGRISASLAGYMAFFCLFGFLFQYILTWSTESSHYTPRVLSSTSVAWLVGFLIPGAPAGAGLRETALTLAVGIPKDSAEVLSAIVLFRLVTLLGDLLAFCAGFWISRRVSGNNAG